MPVFTLRDLCALCVFALKKASIIVLTNTLFPNMNVYQNVSFGLKMKKVDKKTIQQKVDEVLAIVGLENFNNRMPD